LIQDVSIFGEIKQSGKWWLDPWWLKGESKYTRKRIIIAFQKLKDVLDDNWFKSQLTRGDGHPICEHLLGHFPFVLDDLVKLGLDLKEVENCKNVARVIKDLKSASKYLSTRVKRSENKTHLRIGRSLGSLESEFKRAIRNLVKKARKQLPPDSPGIIELKLFTLESSFRGTRDLALEIFQTEFQNNPSKYAHVIGIILILTSYSVQYEKRIIMNPYTKFKSIGKNCGIF